MGVELSELLLDPLGELVRVLDKLLVRVADADSVLVCVVDLELVGEPLEHLVGLELLDGVPLPEFVRVAAVVLEPVGDAD